MIDLLVAGEVMTAVRCDGPLRLGGSATVSVVGAEAGVAITELSAHIQGQLVAVHPAYDLAFDGFAPTSVRGNPKARQAWAVEQMRLTLQASRNFGLDRIAAFSGALAWPYLYPWPQRPDGVH